MYQHRLYVEVQRQRRCYYLLIHTTQFQPDFYVEDQHCFNIDVFTGNKSSSYLIIRPLMPLFLEISASSDMILARILRIPATGI